VTDTRDFDWRLHGPLGSGAAVLRAVLARLLWISVQPRLGFAALPVGWSHRQLEKEAAIHCGVMIELIASKLEKLLSGEATEFVIGCQLAFRVIYIHLKRLGWTLLEFIAEAFPVEDTNHEPCP
jgi:hypothetical protein